MSDSLNERTREAIEASDTDKLLRIVDGACDARDWARLATIRKHCQAAVERGKQLWSIDEHIRYRLALEGPGETAAAAVIEGPARFTLGPMPEVAATRHRWKDLDEHLRAEPYRAITAHERVLRGEDLTDASFDARVLELPARMQSWEPVYPVATYHGDRAEFPTPSKPRFEAVDPVHAPVAEDGPEGAALASLVNHWVEASNGRVQTAAVEGPAAAAVTALGVRRPAMARLTPADTMAWMGWAAASGGGHGPRRGAAIGRFEAWWVVSTVCDLEWPPDSDELAARLDDLTWWAWTDGSSDGWSLRLAIEDAEDGLSWALSASDAKITLDRAPTPPGSSQPSATGD